MANFDRGLLLYVMNLIVLGVVCILYCLFTFCVFCARDSVRPYDLSAFEGGNPESVRGSPLEDSDDTLSHVYVSPTSNHLFPRSSFCDRHYQQHLDIAGRHLVPAFPDNNYQDSIVHEITNEVYTSSSSRNERYLLDNSLVNTIRREEAPSDDPPPPYEFFQPPKYSCLY